MTSRRSLLTSLALLAAGCGAGPLSSTFPAVARSPKPRHQRPDAARSVAVVLDAAGASRGAAFVIDADGLVVTTRAVASAEDLSLRFSDGDVRRATVLGSDPYTNLALLRTTGTRYAPIPIGSSSTLVLGEAVEGFFDLDPRGPRITGELVPRVVESDTYPGSAAFPASRLLRISRRARSESADNPFDVREGGPVLNARGAAVGVVVASGEDGTLALPIEIVQHLRPRLAAADGADLPRVDFGANVVDASDPPWGRADVVGAVVSGLRTDSPAHRAGLDIGDAIVQFDGDRVDDATTLRLLLHLAGPGHVAAMRVVRGNSAIDVAVMLERPLDT